MALPVGLGADLQLDPPLMRQFHIGWLRAGEGAGFHIGRKADAAQLAVLAGRFTPCLEAGPVRPPQAGVEMAGEIAGVVQTADRGAVGQLVGADEVALADLVASEPELNGAFVDQPLDEIGRFRPPGAAIGVN